MRSATVLLVAVAAGMGCAPKPSERVDPRFKTTHYQTIAVIAGGSRREHVVMAQRARQRIRLARVVTVANVKGRWDNEIDAAKALCAGDQRPTLDGFVIVQGDNLALWDCGSQRISWEADGAWEGVDYMTNKLVLFLQSDVYTNG
ncbi:MAG: hypothetical protein EXR93_01580 [Gemmatimonadetes bacterium]|nr:hypothetical protein [Gemmatimonadota bacterium]